MILITGGLGFIGSHTARALLDRGESVLLTRHRTATRPAYLTGDVDDRVSVASLDVTDKAAFLAIGERHEISHVVHLAAAPMTDSIEFLRANTLGLLNALEAARTWGVRRIAVASSIGVYLGVTDIPWREDMRLPLHTDNPVLVVKRAGELFTGLTAEDAGVDMVDLRIGTIWGPRGNPDWTAYPVGRLVHAAVRGESPGLTPVAYAEDGGDKCYVKDCARAIATLLLADTLRHRTYNVSSGQSVTNQEFVSAIKAVVPDADLELPPGRDPEGPAEDAYLDITRLREETGYQPEYDVERGIADYVDWLRAGNDR